VGLFCEGELCAAETDETTCCEDKEACSVMLPGDGKIYCSSMLGNCDNGLVSDAATKECYNDVCSTDRCCISDSGVNLETQFTEPVTQDTFQAAFKIEASFEVLETNPALKDALETSVCEEFVAAANCPVSWCSVEFSAGSVNVVVKIRAPVGESLEEDIRVPAPERVVAAVTSTEGIEAAKKGDTPIGVSEVVAVVVRSGEMEAQPITTTTTTTTQQAPPTTTMPPSDDNDSDDKETDMALRTVPWLALAVLAPLIGL
jgi:hypothetical protein